jgi:hypothetical protein
MAGKLDLTLACQSATRDVARRKNPGIWTSAQNSRLNRNADALFPENRNAPADKPPCLIGRPIASCCQKKQQISHELRELREKENRFTRERKKRPGRENGKE